jgi:hypothetical protein
LETEKNSSLLACLTILKQRNNPALLPTITSEPPATSVRLETFRCDSKGIIQPGHNLGKISLEGPSTIEYGYLLELPKTKLVENDTWETNEDGRPVCIWTVLGTEMVQGVKCIKLIGTQQTEDWGKTRADRQAWKRTDAVWLHPQLGVAQKLERTIEIKEQAHCALNLKPVWFTPDSYFKIAKKKFNLRLTTVNLQTRTSKKSENIPPKQRL